MHNLLRSFQEFYRCGTLGIGVKTPWRPTKPLSREVWRFYPGAGKAMNLLRVDSVYWFGLSSANFDNSSRLAQNGLNSLVA